MESIKGYDHWKTIPPEPEEEKQEYCTCCGDLYTVVTAYTHLTDRRYVKNVRKRSREGKKMAEIWMICKPDLEYCIGAYAYETDMDKAYVHKLADKVAEKNKCKTIVKVL